MIKKEQNAILKTPIASTKQHVNLKKIDFNQLLSDSALQTSRHAKENTLQQDATNLTNDPATTTEEDVASGENLHNYYELALQYIQMGNYTDASAIMQKAIFIDLDSRIPSLVVKSCDYWAMRLKKVERLKPDEFFTSICEAWLNFNKNIVRADFLVLDRIVYAIRMQVFAMAIHQLQDHPSVEQELSYAFALARAYKFRGDYDEAIDSYALVLEMEPKHPAALAELADCYAIIDEEIHAKVLLREAFFHGADRIIMENLDSVMIKQLYQKTQDLQLPQPYVAEWMAVYGVVWGLLSYSRELSKSEYARLNHSIHALRAQVEEHPEKHVFLVPRLIYRLFWLIDYFVANEIDAKVTKESIEKVLFEIKFLDERVYRKYKL
jgi:tetratricopeptide (TPR) repeat protein